MTASDGEVGGGLPSPQNLATDHRALEIKLEDFACISLHVTGIFPGISHCASPIIEIWTWGNHRPGFLVSTSGAPGFRVLFGPPDLWFLGPLRTQILALVDLFVSEHRSSALRPRTATAAAAGPSAHGRRAVLRPGQREGLCWPPAAGQTTLLILSPIEP